MIGVDAISDLIGTYQKHGWILRRVLLSTALDKALSDHKETLFGDVPIKRCDIDGAWFSRPPKHGGVAWEIRYLGDIPYALLETVDEADTEFEGVLNDVESRLRDAITTKRTA